MVRVLALALAISALASPWIQDLEAAPRLSVKARTSIELDGVRRTPSGVVVRGRVVDANTGEPLEGADVAVEVGSERGLARSDDEGRFELPMAIRGDRFDVIAQVSGPGLGDSRSELRDLRVARRPLELTLTIAAQAEGVLAVVRASSEGEPVPGMRVSLSAEGQALATATTAEDGRAERLILRQGALAEPGRKSFRADFPGNELYDPASASASELFTAKTELRLTLASTSIDYDEELRATVTLTDDRGRPVVGALVQLRTGAGDVLASDLTDDDGALAIDTAADEIGAGSISLQARFDSLQPWLESARSEVITIDIAEPKPIPVAYTLGAFGATAFAMLAFFGLRTRPWQRIRKAPPPAEPVADAAPERRPVVGGLSPGRPSLLKTLRKAQDFGFSARVCDAVRGRPVHEARLQLDLGTQRRTGVTSDAGVVTIEDLDTGDWSVTVAARTFVSERFHLTIPHHGELRGARIDLVPVRERIFDMYREAALPRLPSASKWGIWTPRQIIDHVKLQGGSAPALAELTAFVEERYFSQRLPEEDQLPRAAELVAAARREARG